MISNPLYRYQLDSKEIQCICNEFNLGDLIEIKSDLGGLFNTNLKIVTSKGTYVIRILSGLSTEAHLRYQQNIITILRNNEIPALISLENNNGKHYSTYKDRFLQVTPFISGCVFSNDVKQVISNGEMLRKIHDVLSHINTNVIPEWSNYPSNDLLQEGLNKLEELKDKFIGEEIATVYKLYEKVMNKWNSSIVKKLPNTIIHGDWHTWNQLYSEEGNIKCVMDFDFIQRAERIHDIAYSIWAMLSSKYMDETIKLLTRKFLLSYGELTQDEVNILPIAVARAALFFLCTASFNTNPVAELNHQLKIQKPFIEWVLSEQGQKYIRNSVVIN